MGTVSLYGEDQPRVYPLTRIYDPDIHGKDPEASGKIIPEVSSQIVDDTRGLHNQLYTVTAVDPVTYKVTMVPTAIVVTDEAQPDRVLSYGNDVYMLYYATVVITDSEGTIVRLTRLVIDNKLAFFGHHGAMYELVRTNEDGTKTVVSQNFDTSNNPTGPRVPVVETAVPGVRKCVNCYSYADFKDGELIALYIYDASGILITVVQLVTKKALILNELTDSTNPIVAFDLVANQMLDGDIILYTHQNKEELALYPQITYADGTTQVVTIDNVSGFLYGLEDVKTDFAGAEFTLTAKYYIADDVPSTIAHGEGVRFLVCSKTVRIVNTTKYKISKISVIPVWNKELKQWKLELYAYKENRKGFAIITKVATIKRHKGETPEHQPKYEDYSPNEWNKTQELLIETMQIPDSGVAEKYTQTVYVELRDHDTDPATWFLISEKDDKSVPTYGDYTSPHSVPTIYFGAIKGGEVDGIVKSTYRIPIELYRQTTAQTSKDIFLENFYYNALPPKIDQESKAVEPTHFTLRAPISGIVLMTQPREIDKFSEPLFLTAYLNQYVNRTVVMEFWKQLDDSSFEILYGVPVRVIYDPEFVKEKESQLKH